MGSTTALKPETLVHDRQEDKTMWDQGYNTGAWQPSYQKAKPGMKRKMLTLFACDQHGCNGTGKIQQRVDFNSEYETFPCTRCNGTGKHKRTVSVFEKDFYPKMKADRKLSNMAYRGA